MKKYFFRRLFWVRLAGLFIFIEAVSLTLAKSAFAHCPLCVAGAAGGLTLSRLVGIDDSITGVWLAALLGALSFWSESFVKNSNAKIQLRPIIYLAIFALTISSFYKFGLVVKHGDIFGMDKLTFGMVAGGLVFYIVDIFDDLVIKAHKGVYFPYQRIVVALGSMLVLSIGIYILINYYI